MNTLKRARENFIEDNQNPVNFSLQQSSQLYPDQFHEGYHLTDIFDQRIPTSSLSPILKSKKIRPINDLQLSFNLMRGITRALKIINNLELKNLSKQITRPSESKLKSLLERFESLSLPRDLDEIRSVFPSNIRPHLIAAIINRDSKPLKELNFSNEELKALGPHLTYLDLRDVFNDAWTSNEIHLFLKTCVRIETLKINSNKIKKLPPLPFCKKLICYRCEELTEIPPLPLCEKLNCSNCKNLKVIRSLPACKQLICFNCVKLTELPPLNQCEKLNCSNCNQLKALPLLVACKELDCSKCIKIKEITNIFLCESLNCSHCIKLISIPQLPLCNELDCSECIKIKKLPRLILCKTLYCNNCSALEEIVSLPLCRNLQCLECISLTKLPPLPLCKNLYCIGCLRLSELPLLPQCENISCENCPALNLDSVPITLRPQAAHALYQPITLSVHLKDLSEDPLTVLLSLEQSLLRQRMMPSIEFIEQDGRKSPADDIGGVFRIFITRLIQSLISNSESPKQLKFQQGKSKLYTPIFDPTRDQDTQIKGFQILGALFELCYQSAFTKQNVTIGQVFERIFFDMIVGFSSEELETIDADAKELPFEIKLKLINLYSEVYITKVSKLLNILPAEFTTEQFKTLKQFTADLNDDEEKPNLDEEIPTKKMMLQYIPSMQAEAKKIINEMPDAWLPAAIIRKQMLLLPKILEKWRGLNRPLAQTLETNIQGIRDKDSFSKSIKWITENQDLDFRFENTKGYVERWINEATDIDLENFCNFISGSSTIHPLKKLKIVPYNISSDLLPTTHTCNFRMDLPINYETYAKFKEKLGLAIANVNSLESSGLEIA